MGKPHKHSEVIKCWADGAEIQYQDGNGDWYDLGIQNPSWSGNSYRVKHKHQALMDAHAQGAKIQYLNAFGRWVESDQPFWDYDTDYRIKPEPKPNKEFFAEVQEGVTLYFMPLKGSSLANVKFTFDGETNELISVEKI